MPIYQFDGITPVIDSTSFIHPMAAIIGNVIIGKQVYVGPNASLRGDFGRIIIMDGTNVQDNCIIHSFPHEDTVIESNGHIGHGAVLHGCHICSNVLIGINSVIMDGAEIGENSIVGAMSFVKAGSIFGANQLIVGNPAHVLRTLTEQQLNWKLNGTHAYKELIVRCRNTLKEIKE
ncbi:phenylacetic acid degradation protein PaaY [Xenorhabdus sp. SGI246]|uniref:phenylacetic acid degradation protein PaaY n=1 Tax=Xenorhabdus sp. SGI246 TaxID=3158263 RepID=UPI00349F97C9